MCVLMTQPLRYYERSGVHIYRRLYFNKIVFFFCFKHTTHMCCSSMAEDTNKCFNNAGASEPTERPTDWNRCSVADVCRRTVQGYSLIKFISKLWLNARTNFLNIWDEQKRINWNRISNAKYDDGRHQPVYSSRTNAFHSHINCVVIADRLHSARISHSCAHRLCAHSCFMKSSESETIEARSMFSL